MQAEQGGWLGAYGTALRALAKPRRFPKASKVLAAGSRHPGTFPEGPGDPNLSAQPVSFSPSGERTEAEAPPLRLQSLLAFLPPFKSVQLHFR